jgi:hypothetical protein
VALLCNPWRLNGLRLVKKIQIGEVLLKSQGFEPKKHQRISFAQGPAMNLSF